MNEFPAQALPVPQKLIEVPPTARPDAERPRPADLSARGLRPGSSRPRRAGRYLLAGLGLLAVTIAAVGIYAYTRHLNNRTPFQTAAVVQGPVIAAISATGTLNAVINVQVGSQVSGQIKELYADFNSRVTKGQIIARIDPDIFQAQVNQARAQVEAAQASVLNQRAAVTKTRADLENTRAALAVAHAQTAKAQVAVVDGERNLGRQRELRRRELTAQADLDTAQVAYDSALAQHEASRAQERAQAAMVDSAAAQLEVAEAQLKSAGAQVAQVQAALSQAELNLEHTVIRAPVDGVVVSRNVDVGQTVAASLQAPTLFLIAQDLSKMQVDTNVDEADVGRVRVGQPVRFTVDSFPGQTFAGDVVQVRKAPQVVQNVVTYDVVVSAPNPELKLLPGMTANVRIVTDRKDNALKVPNAALRFRPSGVANEPPPQRGPAGQKAPQGPRADSGKPRGLPGQVWVVGADGQPRPVTLVLGISDGTFTEVVEGELADQQQVIVGSISPTPAPAAPAAGGPRLRL
jgi:HlyD family secretion protein